MAARIPGVEGTGARACTGATACPLPAAVARGRPEAMPAARVRQTLDWWARLVALAAAWCGFTYVWNETYAGTPVLFDTAWYAHLVYRNEPILLNPPPVVFATIGPYFYATHFSPALWLLSLPSHLVPVGPLVWLAIVEAVKYGLIALLVGLAVRELAGAVAQGRPPLRSALAVTALAPLNGVLLASVAYPHFESWFVPAALLFFWALLRDRMAWAVAVLPAVLLLREDMGFHLTGLLVMLTAWGWSAERRWQPRLTRWLALAGVAFAGSCAALLIMRVFFPGDTALQRVYLGDPPLAHVTWEVLQARLGFLFEHRAFIWLPALVYLAWAGLSRGWWMLIGYLAFVPWFAFNFLARSLAPATLSLYYSFPYALALLWPLVGWRALRRAPPPASILRWVAVAAGLSIIGFVRGPDAAGLLDRLGPPDLAGKAAREGAVERLAAAGPTIAIDGAVAALAPSRFDARDLIGLAPTDVERVAFFRDGTQADAGWHLARRLPHWFRIEGTPILVAAARPLEWPEARRLSDRPGSMLAFLDRRTWNAGTAGPAERIVAQGPAWYFAPDERWRVTVELSLATPPAGAAAVVCEVVTDHGRRVLGRALLPAPEAGADLPPVQRTFTFTMPDEQPGAVQIRVIAPRGSAGRIHDLTLQPLESP